jgi:hypothetical protein
VEPRAPARSQPKRPSEEVKIAGEVTREAPELEERTQTPQISPNIQKHPRPRTPERRVAATCLVWTAGKSRTTKESPPVRHVHGEDSPKPVDLQPKKRKNPTATHNGGVAIHKIKKTASTVTRRQGHEQGGEDPTTEIYTQQKKTPKVKDLSEEEKL